MIELTLEQQFEHTRFSTLAKQMSREQAIEYLLKLHKQSLVANALYKKLIKEALGKEQIDYASKMEKE